MQHGLQALRTALHQYLKKAGWPAWQSEAVNAEGAPQRGASNPSAAVSAIRVSFQGKVRACIPTTKLGQVLPGAFAAGKYSPLPCRQARTAHHACTSYTS